MQPDLTILNSIATLYGQQDFRNFRGYLAALELEEVRNAIKAVDNADVARGRAQMIMQLRETIETSKERASQMEIRTHDRQAAASRPGGSKAR